MSSDGSTIAESSGLFIVAQEFTDELGLDSAREKSR